jgi:anti-anti-sigma regulatory factor
MTIWGFAVNCAQRIYGMDTVQITEGPEATLVELRAGMEIAMINTLYQKLTPVLAQTTALVLDASQVLHVDTAALQTLVCFCRSAHARDIPIQWRAVSPVVQQAAQRSGLDMLLFG